MCEFGIDFFAGVLFLEWLKFQNLKSSESVLKIFFRSLLPTSSYWHAERFLHERLRERLRGEKPSWLQQQSVPMGRFHSFSFYNILHIYPDIDIIDGTWPDMMGHAMACLCWFAEQVFAMKRGASYICYMESPGVPLRGNERNIWFWYIKNMETDKWIQMRHDTRGLIIGCIFCGLLRSFDIGCRDGRCQMVRSKASWRCLTWMGRWQKRAKWFHQRRFPFYRCAVRV